MNWWDRRFWRPRRHKNDKIQLVPFNPVKKCTSHALYLMYLLLLKKKEKKLPHKKICVDWIKKKIEVK